MEDEQPTPTAAGMPGLSSESIRPFVESTHQYIRDYIQFADQKAAFIFAGATALLAFLHSGHVSERWLKPLSLWQGFDSIAFLAMLALALAVVLAVWVVVPRTPGSRRGLLFWSAIAEFPNGGEYALEVQRHSGDSLTQVMAEHCYDLACICRAKYRVLRLAALSGAVGLVAATLVLLFL